MASIPAGGPSTINGVLYQMLWALHRLGALTAFSPEVDDATGQLTDVTIVLEPPDGGDQQEIQGNRRIVEQIKSRSSLRTWSLQEVIREVLPDLYRAVDLAHSDTVYRFVTEGLPGEWKQVDAFFKSLHGRNASNNVLENLDDTKELKFRRSNRSASEGMTESFWGSGPYTERRLFKRIVSALRKNWKVEQEPLAMTHQKLWHLLGNFTFDGGHSFIEVQATIDAWLLSVIDAAEDLPTRRNALLLDLARRAIAGNARIVAREFLAEHNLNATPLTDWLKIYQKAANHLERMLHRRGFDCGDDARPHSVVTAASHWTAAARPILVLTGESGQGKTWLGYALLARVVAQGEVALLVDTTGRTDDALKAAAATFWQEIVGHDNAPPFVRIRDRLRQCGPVHATRPLYLLIDRVIDHDEAHSLALKPWEDWDIRLVITCFPDVAATIRGVARDRCAIVPVPDFSTEELHTYLSDVIGDRWPTIPADVRATLRRPLLARLYRDVASSAIWQPTSEYELYKKFWNRLYTGTQADYPMDADILKRAAYALTQQDENYPWTAAQLSDNATIQRLIKVGWLRSPQLGWYEVWHNRLLNWAVAEGLAHELYHRRLDTAKTCQIIQQLHSSPGLRRPRFLGYVPMDFLWLITEPALGMDDLAVQVLEAMELASRVMSQPDQMYLHLVPTLGPRIAPALFKRLETVAEQNNFVLLDSLVKAIASLEGDQVSMRAAALLDHPSPYVQRAAMQILARKPIAGLLDRLWALHCSRHADPQQFLREHEYPMAAYEDTFSALRSCVVLNPTWLEEAIRRADPAQEPVQDLAYLVASLDDGGEIWKRCKPMLYTKVSTLHERSLANNIGKYRDTEEVAWLLARVHRADDLVGPVALRALIRLDANLALQHLDRLPDWELRATRDWCFAELLAQLPDETLLHFLDRLHQHPNPWELAMVFQGYENAVDTRILEILLNRLAVLLAEEIGQPLPAGRGSRVRLPFLLLLPMARPELLECFRQQRGALLEHNLTTWLLDRGPQQGDWRQHEKCDGLGVLAKIGGPGLTTVVNQWLLAADRYGRMEAMEIAPRRPDTTTIELLRNISQSEELWDNFPVEQGYAAKSLAAAGDWESVIAYLVRWGLQTLIAVTDYRHEAGLLDDRAMTLALHALSSETLPCPGIVLALGFGGRTDCIEWIHKTLDRALADSDVAHACALALDWLRDTDPETVPLLARQLTVPSHRHDAVIALLKNGTDLALDTLLHHLRTAYHHGLAICLLNDHRTVAAVMPLVQQRLYEADDETKLNMIADLLARIRDEDLLDSLLSETAMRDFLRETSFADEGSVWVIGEKIRAIRGLARFDPESASLAAQTALQNVDAHDRELYPYLLVEFERDRAVSLLLEQARHELATSVMWAIARSLAAADYIEPLRALFASPDATRRRTACRLAGRLPSDEWLLAAVRDCLGDADSSVADSAHEALEMLHDGATANALLEALRTETDNTHRWVLLDALWAVGDPGDAQQPWPTWAQRAAVYLSHSMDAYLAEQIKKRRQEVLESARQKDK